MTTKMNAFVWFQWPFKIIFKKVRKHLFRFPMDSLRLTKHTFNYKLISFDSSVHIGRCTESVLSLHFTSVHFIFFFVGIPFFWSCFCFRTTDKHLFHLQKRAFVVIHRGNHRELFFHGWIVWAKVECQIVGIYFSCCHGNSWTLFMPRHNESCRHQQSVHYLSLFLFPSCRAAGRNW